MNPIDDESGAVRIDTTFDVRTDSGTDRRGAGRDPDRYSPTLRTFHRALWSKPLPDGGQFTIADSFPAGHLTATTTHGEIDRASDSIVHTLGSFRGMKTILARLERDELEEFRRAVCTIGGYTLFPAERVSAKPTINQTRGMHPLIRDRFDLTLECIRRHYAGLDSPLSTVLARFAVFFELFTGFRGYVEFFLPQDLLEPGLDRILFWTESGKAPSAPVPGSVRAYRAYRDRSTAFVVGRNARMVAALSSR